MKLAIDFSSWLAVHCSIELLSVVAHAGSSCVCLKPGLVPVSGHRQSVVTGFARVDLSHHLQAHPADFTAVS